LVRKQQDGIGIKPEQCVGMAGMKIMKKYPAEYISTPLKQRILGQPDGC
jgi:hypothetical protein